MSENGEIFDETLLTIEQAEFDNYRQKQRYYDEKYKNRSTILHEQPMGSVVYQNGCFYRKMKGTTMYKVDKHHGTA